VAACNSFGLPLSAEQIERMWRHFDLVREANRHFNLTRITEVRRGAVEHYADSLTLVRWLADRGVRPRYALDVGTGGGWPAVPLAILMPDTQWTAVDSTGKKARFVAEAAEKLSLSNLTARQERIGEACEDQASYDLIVCRAVGKLAELVGTAEGRLAADGRLVCYKTVNLSQEERQAGCQAAVRYGLDVAEEYPVRITSSPESYDRLLVVYHSPRMRRQKASAKRRGK